MNHLAIFLCSLLGFAALAMAMDRHQADVLGRALSTGATRVLRMLGWAGLVAALVVAVRSQGWSLGLVSLSGHTSFGAGLVFGGLIAWHRRKSRG